TGVRNLCLAGGVALNCVANGKILRDGRFENIWIQPASGDAGGAVGAALGAYHMMLDQPRYIKSTDSMKGAFLGPEFSQPEIDHRLKEVGAVFRTVSDDELIDTVAGALADRKTIGWH